jgi:hypothetical protein
MFDYLRGLATRVMARLERFDPPEEPHSFVRQPRPIRPNGRNTSIALDEPREPSDVHAIGRGKP